MPSLKGGYGSIICPSPEVPDLSAKQLKALHTFRSSVATALQEVVMKEGVPEKVVIALLLFFAAKANKDLHVKYKKQHP
jgi:hypothetical protein